MPPFAIASAPTRGEDRGDGEGGRGSREPLENGNQERGNEAQKHNGCIGTSSREEEALAARASLRWPVDPALLPGDYLIETASVGETVAAEYSVSGPARGRSDCRLRQAYSRRDG